MHIAYMKLALEQAKLAQEKNEVPIGAVLVVDDEVISKQHNQTITNKDPTAHAEILCIREACLLQNNHRLTNATLYITLEPCIMCYGAIIQSRVKHVVYGAIDPKSGVFSKPHLINHLNLNHHPQSTSAILAKESQALLQSFFQERR